MAPQNKDSAILTQLFASNSKLENALAALKETKSEAVRFNVNQPEIEEGSEGPTLSLLVTAKRKGVPSHDQLTVTLNMDGNYTVHGTGVNLPLTERANRSKAASLVSDWAKAVAEASNDPVAAKAALGRGQNQVEQGKKPASKPT